jgi:DNA-binding transcriptional LysR family regulator
MPPYIAEAALAAGELVSVLTAKAVTGAGLYLVYPSNRNVPRKLTAVRDFLVDWLRTHPLLGTRVAR